MTIVRVSRPTFATCKVNYASRLVISLLMPLGLCGFANPLVGQETSQSGGQAREAIDPIQGLLIAERKLLNSEYPEAIRQADELSQSGKLTIGQMQRAAEILYRAGASQKSLKLFDRVVERAPRQAPYNWQRGIALASQEKWKEGAAQFKTHHDVNPDDVENSAWYFLCVAKSAGLEEARKTVIPSRGDGRQPMMSVLAMLKEQLKPDEVIDAAVENTVPGPERSRAKFYADLYVGLYYDSLDEDTLAEKYLRRSQTYDSQGYMVDVARVYCEDRFGQAKDAQN